jgi:hypothetical protein
VLGCLVAKSWYRVALLLLLPGCLVSFNDYPLEVSGGGAGQAAGGSSSSAGTAAMSGAAPMAGSSSGGMIDDFEDGNQNILELAGRSGAWYVANDGQGTQTPAANMPVVPSLLMPARGMSTRAAHTFGGPFAQWGALIGVSLSSDQAYDLSRFSGVRFWVRSGAFNPGAANRVRFMLPTAQTNAGGGCTVCNDHFGVFVPLTPQWTRIEVEFSELAQEGFGAPEPPSPDLTTVSAIQFIFPQGVSFDLWVDDVELY